MLDLKRTKVSLSSQEKVNIFPKYLILNILLDLQKNKIK